jgi:hypothetical protein
MSPKPLIADEICNRRTLPYRKAALREVTERSNLVEPSRNHGSKWFPKCLLKCDGFHNTRYLASGCENTKCQLLSPMDSNSDVDSRNDQSCLGKLIRLTHQAITLNSGMPPVSPYMECPVSNSTDQKGADVDWCRDGQIIYSNKWSRFASKIHECDYFSAWSSPREIHCPLITCPRQM